MLIVTRNGRTTVITGWRAWLVGAGLLVAAWLMLAFFGVLVLGAAITASLLLLLLIPAAALMVLIQWVSARRR